MRTVATTVISVLFSTGLQVSGYVNPTVTVTCWSLIVPVVLAAYFWPRVWFLIKQVKRLRLRWPITLASAEATSNDLQQAQSWEAHQLRGVTIRNATDERPWIRDEELSEPRFEERSASLAEFARKAAVPGLEYRVIRERTFVKCDIYGPCVVIPTAGKIGGKTFIDCEWLDEANTSWPPQAYAHSLVGVIVLEDCRFRECRFTLVGVLQDGQAEG